MSDIIPACKTCKYFVDDDELFSTCINPEYGVRKVNFIDGEVTYGRSLCGINRQKENLCGEAGRGWEAKPVPELPEQSSIIKWFNLF